MSISDSVIIEAMAEIRKRLDVLEFMHVPGQAGHNALTTPFTSDRNPAPNPTTPDDTKATGPLPPWNWNECNNRIRALEAMAHPNVETVPLGRFVALENAIAQMTAAGAQWRDRTAAALERIAASYPGPTVTTCQHINNTRPPNSEYIMDWCKDCGAVRIGGTDEWALPINSESGNV